MSTPIFLFLFFLLLLFSLGGKKKLEDMEKRKEALQEKVLRIQTMVKPKSADGKKK